MKKSLIIIVLTLSLGACATRGPAPGGSAALLGFDAISAEITVGYTNLEAADELSHTIAMNRQK